MKIKIENILPNPEQPRSEFDQAEMDSLAESLARDGLLNPIAVEGPLERGVYVLLDGERRWRAAIKLGWSEIEAHARPVNGTDPEERLLLALVGNLQRSDMGVVDMARGYKRLYDHGLSAEEIGRRVGRSKSNVLARLRLLDLPEEVQELYNAGKLPLEENSMTGLRKLPPEVAILIARTAARKQLTGRQIVSACARAMRSEKSVKKGWKKKVSISSESLCPALDYNPELSKTWSWVRGAARKTCYECGMYEGGGIQQICRDCPLTLFIGRIVAGHKAKEDNHV